MKIFIHADIDSGLFLTKLSWMLCEGSGKFIQSDSLSYGTNSFIFDMIQFLFAMGKADTIVGYDIDTQIKAIGKSMKHDLIKLTVERPNKISHLDLKIVLSDMEKPNSVLDVVNAYSKHIFMRNNF